MDKLQAGADADKQKTPASAQSVAGVSASTPDWGRIELDYRAGVKALRQIASEHGITHGAINKRAKRDGWERDLGPKINAKADALVSKAAVSTEVSMATRIAEKQVIEANAQAVADIRLAHRRDIHRARRITNSLLDELEQQTDPATLALLQDLGDLLRRPDNNGQDKLNDLYQRVISLAERSKTLKVLSESLRVMVDMERTAFGMDRDTGQRNDPLATLLTKIASGNGNGWAPIQDDPERQTSPNGFTPQEDPDED